VSRLETGAAQDLLVVRLSSGGEALVPFVEAIVPEVDVEGGRVVLNPPPGLLELGTES
jgi:16S rRNA processing protein RimM